MRAVTLTLLLFLVIVFVLATIICHIIALATHHWLQSSDDSQINFLHLGLFVACFDGYSHPHETPKRFYDGCHGLTSDHYATIQDWLVPSWLVSCKLVAIIALILQFVGLLCLVLLILGWFCKWVCCDNKRGCCERCLMYAAPIMFMLAGMFLMTAVMMFADNAFRLQCKDFWLDNGDPNVNDLSWSWGFEVAACVLAFLAGGFMIWLVAVKARDDVD